MLTNFPKNRLNPSQHLCLHVDIFFYLKNRLLKASRRQKSLLGLVNKNVFMYDEKQSIKNQMMFFKHQNCHKSIYIHLFSNNGNEKLLEMIEKENILIINVSVIPLIINQLDKSRKKGLSSLSNSQSPMAIHNSLQLNLFQWFFKIK